MECFQRQQKRRIAKSDVNESAASLALRWLYDQPQVTCVLSGMNSMEMVNENCKTASLALPGCLTDDERQLIEDVKNDIKNSVKVGCTGCNYCCPCPKGVDIPAVFQCYNQLSEDSHARWRYIQMTTFRKRQQMLQNVLAVVPVQRNVLSIWIYRSY